ncbi:MAG: nicotinate-nucleotide--dimethylbenzimidazole phosphoribosyltransferase [Pseudomonadota bacterium]
MDHTPSAEEIAAFIDAKTKPIGALGRIETLAALLARQQRTLTPRLETLTLVVFAADHGIAAEGVSAYPQAVTVEMVRTLLAGGAAANVFAAAVGAEVRIVDAGIAHPFDHSDLVLRRQGAGTANAAQGPAMSTEIAAAARAAGEAIGAGLGTDAAAFGEMGIANTSAAALLAHKLTELPLDRLVGRGTGLDDAGLAAKRRVLEAAAARTGPLSAEAAAAEYGGFEIVMMAGAMIGAAQAGRPVLVDGFIATTAALLALSVNPEIRPALLFCHRSAEPGHSAILEHLAAEPLLDLGLRLGEGTGALLAWPLIRAAARMLSDMASFDSAGVSRAER